MGNESALLPDELERGVDVAARRFNTSRAELVRRAVEHYLAHIDELALPAARPETDWGKVKETLHQTHCPWPYCPFAGDCPVEICPL